MITGLRAFDSTVHTTRVWLNDLTSLLGWPDDDLQGAYLALRSVLHALRDRLPVDHLRQRHVHGGRRLPQPLLAERPGTEALHVGHVGVQHDGQRPGSLHQRHRIRQRPLSRLADAVAQAPLEPQAWGKSAAILASRGMKLGYRPRNRPQEVAVPRQMVYATATAQSSSLGAARDACCGERDVGVLMVVWIPARWY